LFAVIAVENRVENSKILAARTIFANARDGRRALLLALRDESFSSIHHAGERKPSGRPR
jgi:hypothetical protein